MVGLPVLESEQPSFSRLECPWVSRPESVPRREDAELPLLTEGGEPAVAPNGCARWDQARPGGGSAHGQGWAGHRAAWRLHDSQKGVQLIPKRQKTPYLHLLA